MAASTQKELKISDKKHVLPSLSEENVVKNLGEKGFTYIDGFLDEKELLTIRAYILDLYQNQRMRSAAIGKDALEKIQKEVRNDLIKWIDFSTPGPVNDFFLPKLNRLIEILNSKCFLGIKDFETHFTCYPPGSFYKKHFDQFKGNNNRIVSFICYLNDLWLPEMGGQLRIHKEDELIDIDPVGGRLALFLSDEVEHEVLVTNKERLSITGWMLKQDMKIGFINNF